MNEKCRTNGRNIGVRIWHSNPQNSCCPGGCATTAQTFSFSIFRFGFFQRHPGNVFTISNSLNQKGFVNSVELFSKYLKNMFFSVFTCKDYLYLRIGVEILLCNVEIIHLWSAITKEMLFGLHIFSNKN